MCFELDARPPIAPIAGGAVDASDLTLTSADGTRVLAFAARATRPTGAGMLVLPDVRGLHTYYKELALRFAEAGIDAVAIDYFGRTAPSDDRGEGFDFQAHVPQTRQESLQADVNAGAEHLRSEQGGRVRALFSVGFCFGGALSFLQAANGPGMAGVIGFYGWPLGRGGRPPQLPTPIELVDRYTCPVLSLFGGADEGIPPEAVQQWDAALSAAGVEHETTTYDGAPHSFFDRRQEEFADASADAWRRVREFVAKHTKD